MNQLPEIAPTPVFEGTGLSSPERRLWVKNDGSCDPEYGGNKVRKLRPHLLQALQRGARRIVTFGAAGSHHVLATTLFSRRLGLGCAAVLLPQPESDHAWETLRCALGAGLTALAAPTIAHAAWLTLKNKQATDYLIAPGASSPAGALGYVDAIAELRAQISAGMLPEPDLIVVPLGSGGTAAGMLAGVIHHGLKSRIVAVQVARGPLGTIARTLAARVLHDLGRSVTWSTLRDRLIEDASAVGLGYGYATERGSEATEAARALGLVLDQTYTAKAFGQALALIREPRRDARHVLYWHTLSQTSCAKWLARAPDREQMAPELQRLLLPLAHGTAQRNSAPDPTIS